jgi:uncharacterized protein DUF5648
MTPLNHSLRSRALAFFFAASMACAGLVSPPKAVAFGNIPAFPREIVEFYNTSLGHYFYTLSYEEAAGIDAGNAGPGWARTGLSFAAYPSRVGASIGALGLPTGYPPCDQEVDPCVPVARFYSGGPNSHFFTGNRVEADLLKQPGSGWTFEGQAFFLPMPRDEQCAQGRVPVYRLYNNRFRFNDTNHRFTASTDARDRMLTNGWVDEGIAFCAYFAANSGESYLFRGDDPASVQSRDACDGDAAPVQCIGFSNVPLPTQPYEASSFNTPADAFNAKTGLAAYGGVLHHNLGVPASSREAAADDVFVQLGSSIGAVGVHVATPSRGASPHSYVTLLTNLGRLAPFSGRPDLFVYPWRERYGTGHELAISFRAHLHAINVSNEAHAYGNAVLSFADSHSGRGFRFNLLAYGTLPPGEGVGRDVRDGSVIVGATLRDGSSFGRNIRDAFFPVSHNFLDSRNDVRSFEFRIDAREFGAILAAARTLDPNLSPYVTDYHVRQFGMNHEVYTNGEIGANVMDLRLAVVPR